ncbi:hypothetical protein I307_01393 [Cryptococcus deuterogattii 99/473]|uniref:Uncharacterized protein n=1 Tax=Cryptococcus deuterogattii Ram5 TaxID=1296110 RepID=A0A0D0UZ85_9TREE|nr:hypothetical protein I309_01553 [Cryptococcus deuterogattii LA55]KIR39514.1 hypothetical protein I313_04537 [Cryptococcus deuterogattii Ram5]KIR73849.1 hypothetical protein I310_02524 [Cryptococcus deuterogattii CA1014]KIR93341.1 hypothetical protein I304_03007 [Cryptococcus deuterogattii CBS 10090]KIY59144.1 hypothetical protein I307_01393 [Cryptococcus deuterogattii 99/473]
MSPPPPPPPPLTIPILLHPTLPSQASHTLPLRPTHIAHWTAYSDHSQSVYTALAAQDNTIWVVADQPAPPLDDHDLLNEETSILIPSISTSSPISSRRSRPAPAQPRTPSQRPRATSTASTAGSSSQHHACAFSPPLSAHQLPTTTLSSATASAAPPDQHVHRSSLSGRMELMGQLREHNSGRENAGMGKGLGIGRRGLTGVHGQAEQNSGTTSPRSAMSLSTDTTGTAGLFSFWQKGSQSDVEEKEREVEEIMQEINVEREMEKERRESKKESEDLKVVEAAIERSPNPDQGYKITESHARSHGCEWGNKKIWRIVLRRVDRGKIVSLKVIEELGILCVLRDQGVMLLQFNQDQQPLLDPIAMLELPGEGAIGLCQDGDTNYLIHATPTSLTSYPIIFPQYKASCPGSLQFQPRHSSSAFPSRSHTPNPESSDASSSLLRKSASSSRLLDSHQSHAHEKEHSFARFLARRTDWSKKKDEEHGSQPIINPGLGEGKEVERDGYGHWTRIKLKENGEGVGWTDDGVDEFQCDGKSMWVKGTISWTERVSAREVVFSKNWARVVILRDVREILKAECDKTDFDGKDYKLAIYAPHHGEAPKEGSRLKFEQKFIDDGVNAICLTDSGKLLLSNDNEVQMGDIDGPLTSFKTYLSLAEPPAEESGCFSHVVPYGLEDAFVADSQGNVCFRRLDSVIHQDNTNTDPVADNKPTIDRLDAAITCMKLIRGPEENDKMYLVAGDEDGVIRIWIVDEFQFCGSWTLFAWPVSDFVLLDMPQAGTLRGTLLCTSQAGTVGIISMSEMEQLFLIPAARSPLRHIYLGNSDILLVYANGKARVWNTETQEFRRSTGLDAAEDMLQAGNWTRVDLTKGHSQTPLTACVAQPYAASQLGRLLNLDLRELGRWLHSSKNNPHHSPLSALRSLLSILLTFGVNEKVDEICTRNLGVHKPEKPILIGYGNADTHEIAYAQGIEAWQMSERITGVRQLAIITVLRPFLDSPDLERWAAEVIAFYTASLHPNIIEPDLEFFASYYMDPSSDVHQAARLLFAARVRRLSGSEIDTVVRIRQHELPILQPEERKFSGSAANALTVLGGIAVQKYQCMRPTSLKALSESVTLYLHEPNCDYISLAVELCSKGFTTWQSYVDPSDLLRRLFHLATNKEPPSMSSHSSTSIAAQARLAILLVASSNPPLFMSTLSMDILDAKSAESRSSIMKLCVFMARKKPAVLENGLPRIAEAVVKSLDPNVGKMRDDVWQAATVILNELVLAAWPLGLTKEQ